ncbi:polysaccharide deacetylase family protein [Streptomyces sp. H27-C3]|uniref:polysaccharide deacetylase family protein n=1 Tax=Streptomyces sp. H27-C3 TaxID=3046305 RepID=UPI0024BB6318|nr:polysaccharide deacetylase family protein [Streptomyces sp. H27-C3]MDJ0466400.1 polysaccharide deacetylase family protein [Streptomyces sp. H27-C3]
MNSDSSALPRLLPRRRLLLLAAATGAATLLTGPSAAAAPGREPVPVEERLVNAPPRTIALTFDDGPSPLYTPQLLAVLARHGITATFFVLGANAARYPGVIRLIAAHGHVVGNHTWDHPRLDRLPGSQVREQILRTQEVVTRTTGRPPTLFRAPGGHFAPAALAVCAERGLRAVGWSVDTVDWTNPGAGRIAATVLEQAATGAIVLQHDGFLSYGPVPAHQGRADRTQTVQAADRFLPQLLAAGYRFATP